MRKLNFFSLRDSSEVLSDDMMKQITGGTTCYFEISGTNINGCTNNSNVAYTMGYDGHWECNTSYASSFCSQYGY